MKKRDWQDLNQQSSLQPIPSFHAVLIITFIGHHCFFTPVQRSTFSQQQFVSKKSLKPDVEFGTNVAIKFTKVATKENATHIERQRN